jgi:hypothetical protein
VWTLEKTSIRNETDKNSPFFIPVLKDGAEFENKTSACHLHPKAGFSPL